jgi:hypothetical protein
MHHTSPAVKRQAMVKEVQNIGKEEEDRIF